MPSFIDKGVDCNDSKFNYICNYGHLVSPLIAWLGVALLMLFIIMLVQCKKRHVRYQNFYNFWKGFNRWYLAPIVYYSSNTIIDKLRAETNQTDEEFIAAAVLLGYCVLWPHVELIGYKCTQTAEDNIWKKWIEYFSHLRMILIVLLANYSLKFDAIAKYFIYGVLVLYQLLYMCNYKFTFKCC